MKQSLKILMLLHMPWTRNLGGSRVQLELAEEFRKLGHEVEKFDYYDAFSKAKSSSRLEELFRPSFSVKAKAFVKANAHRFDIIDAHQGNLPYSKEELGFKGLLVARSVGLYAFYDEFSKSENIKNPPRKLKTQLGNFLRSWNYNRELPLYPRSLQTCDIINVPNYDELAYVSDVLNLGDKCVVFPFGLTQERYQKFKQAIKSSEARLANKQIAFIGSWGSRKGSRDWPQIITQVKQKVPSAKFLFLGTGLSGEKVLQDLNLPPCDWIDIIPQYDSEELPMLLSGATVGAFPSYIEGFPFAVLEQLASGLPTVAYDVPGPRETLRILDDSFLVSVGSTENFSNKLVNLLNSHIVSYSNLTQHCIEVAAQFSWKIIARKNLDMYLQSIQTLKL